MLCIDGSQGEGGGQILRTALALSLVTGTPFRIEKIRAGRPRPGLLRQHLAAVRAAAAVGGADVSGDALGSDAVELRPRAIRAGEYHFAVGSAGSACLVLQTVLPALLHASGPSRVEIEGGTHASFAPPYDFVERVYAPLLSRMGAEVHVALRRPGFMPVGGGKIELQVAPARLQPIELLERGEVRQRRASVWLAHLPRHVAEREHEVVREGLGWEPEELDVIDAPTATSPGNALMLRIESEHVTELISEIGTRGTAAETVARRAVRRARRYLRSGVPVGTHLADQLLLPLALAGGGAFRTGPLSRHAQTHRQIVELFLPVEVSAASEGECDVRVEVSGTSRRGGGQ